MAKLKMAVHYFLVGLGSVLGGQQQAGYLKKTDEQALASDLEAIGKDFAVVGEDIVDGIKQCPDKLTVN